MCSIRQKAKQTIIIYFNSKNTLSDAGRPPGFDRVRGAEIGNKDFNLDVLEEAYTTEHWLVRIYKVKPLPNRGVWVVR